MRVETWLDKGDGVLRNGDTVMTHKAFAAAFPHALRVTLKLGGDSGNELY